MRWVPPPVFKVNHTGSHREPQGRHRETRGAVSHTQSHEDTGRRRRHKGAEESHREPDRNTQGAAASSSPSHFAFQSGLVQSSFWPSCRCILSRLLHFADADQVFKHTRNFTHIKRSLNERRIYDGLPALSCTAIENGYFHRRAAVHCIAYMISRMFSR